MYSMKAGREWLRAECCVGVAACGVAARRLRAAMRLQRYAFR